MKDRLRPNPGGLPRLSEFSESWGMPIIAGKDSNEACDVFPMEEHLRGPRGGCRTVTCNGIPVPIAPPDRRDLGGATRPIPTRSMIRAGTCLTEVEYGSQFLAVNDRCIGVCAYAGNLRPTGLIGPSRSEDEDDR
jgi:hypothetical protein